MDRCETCKWWGTYEDDPEPEYGWCQVARTIDRKHTNGTHDKPLMRAYSGNDGLAGLITFPNFGCVMHKSKDTD